MRLFAEKHLRHYDPDFYQIAFPAEYGQYNVFNSWMGIVGILVSLNLSGGVYDQGLVKFEKEEAIFSSAIQGLSTTLVGGWTAVYLIFHDFWNDLFSLTTVQMLSMLAMIWASAVFGFWASAQRVHYKYRMLVFATVMMSLAKPLVGILFVTHAQDKVTARILGLALVEMIGYSAMFRFRWRRVRDLFMPDSGDMRCYLTFLLFRIIFHRQFLITPIGL